jgi:hypothetical protein
MNEFDCYRMFLSIKTHFTRLNYDYFKYNKQTKLNRGTFEKRNDKEFFKRLVRKYKTKENLENFFVANFIYSVGDYYVTDNFLAAHRNYLKYVKIKGALKYYFNEDIQTLKEYCEKHNISNYLYVYEEKLPVLLTLFYQRKINFETLFVLNKLRPYLKYWNSKIKNEFIWPETYKKLLKFDSFCAKVNRTDFIREYKKTINN